MKTTLELPDDLFVAAKRRAALERTTLRAIVERGLRAQLNLRCTSGCGAADALTAFEGGATTLWTADERFLPGLRLHNPIGAG